MSGPRTANSDSILARLSDGEGILTATATDRIGADGLAHLNAGGDVGRSGWISTGPIERERSSAWRPPGKVARVPRRTEAMVNPDPGGGREVLVIATTFNGQAVADHGRSESWAADVTSETRSWGRHREPE